MKDIIQIYLIIGLVLYGSIGLYRLLLKLIDKPGE